MEIKSYGKTVESCVNLKSCLHITMFVHYSRVINLTDRANPKTLAE